MDGAAAACAESLLEEMIFGELGGTPCLTPSLQVLLL